MISIKVVYTGSDGNSTILTDKDTGKCIVMDCGVEPPPRLKFEDVIGVFITHSHSDHCRWLNSYRGKTVYCSEKELNVDRIRKKSITESVIMKAYEPVTVGPFTVTPYPADHDTPEPMHYLVETEDDSIWYGCDACGYTDELYEIASHCNRILLECNYDDDMMENDRYNIVSYPGRLKDRICNQGHCSNKYIKSRFGDVQDKLVLMHISSNYNSLSAIKKVFGKVRVVDKTRCPYRIK